MPTPKFSKIYLIAKGTRKYSQYICNELKLAVVHKG